MNRAFLMEARFIEEETEGKDVSKFLENERYAAMYLYDDDLIKETGNKKMILFTKSLTPQQRKFVTNWQNKYCGEVYFGHSNGKMSPEVIKSVNLTEQDFPFIIFHDKDCTSVYMGKPEKLHESGFVEDSLKRKNCGKIQGTARREKLEHVAEVKGSESNLTSKTTFTGFMVELVYFSIGLASIFILKLLYRDRKVS